MTTRARASGPAALLFGFRQDLRHTARALLRRPGFSAAIVTTIALGVGANTAIFSVVDAALLRPLPYRDADRLVHLWQESESGIRFESSYPDFLDFRARAITLDGVAGYHTARVTLGAGDGAVVLPAAKVTANFFDVLGVVPAAGRRFETGEDDIGGPRVALISHDLWRRAFGGDRSIVGDMVRLDGTPFTIAGVLPPGFQFAGTASAEVWLPIDRPADMRERRNSHWLKAIARLRPGADLAVAQRDLSRVMRELESRYPENTGKGIVVVPLRDQLVGTVRPLLLTLYGAVAFVLLVACGNVANLLLMHGTARQRELSVRAALGAGRWRLARQLLTESTLLALAGGALGVAVAYLAMGGLVAAMPPEQAKAFPYLRDVTLNRTVLLYAGAVSLAVGGLAGLTPALRAGRAHLGAALRQGGGSTPAGHRFIRDGLVVAELAFTVVLVSGAALFARSLNRLLAIDPGFREEGVLTMWVPLPVGQYPTDESARRFYRALEERVAALPGVTHAGFVSKLPLDQGNYTSYQVVGDPPPEPGREPGAGYRVADTDYFTALGIPVLRGRSFGAEDSAAGRTLLINRAMALKAFGARDPIGRQVLVGGEEWTIIGVVGDVAIGKLEDEIPPTMYYSYLQEMEASLRLVVKSRGDPRDLIGPIRAAIGEIDPGVASYQAYTMGELVGQSQSVFLRQYPLLLIGGFALVALVLALVGTYGVMSYAVTQRFRELGIRVALGARRPAILWLVLRHAGGLAAAGVALGVLAALGLSRVASSLLYGIGGSAPLIFGGVALLLAGMTVLAALLPARRAAAVDPLVALRAE